MSSTVQQDDLLTKKDSTKAAIVCTLRMPAHASTTTQSFVEYHTKIGFSHIFLFFDVNTPSPAYKMVCEKKSSNVTAFLRDEALKSKLKKLSIWKDWGEFYEEEVQARQSLNATLALKLCRVRGLRWLLHIDSDELFHVSNSDTIHAHFDQLERDNVMALTYTNHEGVRVLMSLSLYLGSLVTIAQFISSSSCQTGTRKFQYRHTHTTRLLPNNYSISKALLES